MIILIIMEFNQPQNMHNPSMLKHNTIDIWEAMAGLKEQLRNELKVYVKDLLLNENVQKENDRTKFQTYSTQKMPTDINLTLDKLMQEQNRQAQILINHQKVIKELKEQLNQQKRQINSQKRQMRDLQNQLTLYIKGEIETIQTQINDSIGKIRQSEDNLFSYFKSQSEQNRNQLFSAVQRINIIDKLAAGMQKPMLKCIQFLYANHPRNNNQRDFMVTQSLSSVKIKKITDFIDSKYVNYIKTGEIPFNSINRFKIRLLSANSPSFKVGITTNSQRSLQTELLQAFRKSKIEEISYSCYTGSICENDVAKKGGRKIIHGQVLDFYINTEIWRLRWSVQDEILVEMDLPAEMQEKSLYLLINMRDKDDVAQILLI